MTQVSQKTIDFIKYKQIQPISRRILFLKWVTLWLLIIICILIGSSVFSILFFGLLDNDWNVFLPLGSSFLDHIISNVPLLWILSALLFALITSFIFRSTKQGYHYKKRGLVMASLCLSIALGGCLQLAGWGTILDQLASKDVSGYESVTEREFNLWERPEHGLLTGEIESFDDNHAMLKSPSGEIWTVSLPTVINTDYLKNNNCKNVKIVGTPGESKTFIAKEIYPWKSKFYTCLQPAK